MYLLLACALTRSFSLAAPLSSLSGISGIVRPFLFLFLSPSNFPFRRSIRITNCFLRLFTFALLWRRSVRVAFRSCSNNARFRVESERVFPPSFERKEKKRKEKKNKRREQEKHSCHRLVVHSSNSSTGKASDVLHLVTSTISISFTCLRFACLLLSAFCNSSAISRKANTAGPLDLGH